MTVATNITLGALAEPVAALRFRLDNRADYVGYMAWRTTVAVLVERVLRRKGVRRGQ